MIPPYCRILTCHARLIERRRCPDRFILNQQIMIGMAGEVPAAMRHKAALFHKLAIFEIIAAKGM